MGGDVREPGEAIVRVCLRSVYNVFRSCNNEASKKPRKRNHEPFEFYERGRQVDVIVEKL